MFEIYEFVLFFTFIIVICCIVGVFLIEVGLSLYEEYGYLFKKKVSRQVDDGITVAMQEPESVGITFTMQDHEFVKHGNTNPSNTGARGFGMRRLWRR